MGRLPPEKYTCVAAPDECPSCGVSFKPEAPEKDDWDSSLLGHWDPDSDHWSGARMAVHEGVLVAHHSNMDGAQHCWTTPDLLECELCSWKAKPTLKE